MKAPVRAKSAPAKRPLAAPAAAKKAEPPASAETLRYRATVPQIEKRDGRLAPFDFDKIVAAIEKAMAAADNGTKEDAILVAHQVAGELSRFAKKYKTFLPTVEGIQDSVEKHLIINDYVAAAKAYILYRDKRAQLRSTRVEVPEHVRKLAEESKKYFLGNELGEFVYLRTYAKWIPAEGRRETWIETVDRYMGFMRENLGDKLTEKEYAELREAILRQQVMPSMRLMQFAGDAARKSNVCAYNCSYIAPAKLEDFAEIMYISMCGTGIGYSVESANVEQLPQIKGQTGEHLGTHVVADSKEGWCDALTLGLRAWYGGKDVSFDLSQIRPAGARLKTMGGKASGPEPLRSLLSFARERIMARPGRRLRTIDVHDIICKIGECVVAGGVRRSAMISLSDLDDELLRDAKKGQFFLSDPHRSIANNSAVYMEKPTNEEFMDEWVALMKSRSGERGIFNRGGLMTQLPERRRKVWEATGYIENGRVAGPAGTNPCGEIVLKSKQFCNLTEVIARHDDTRESLVRKARLATILGTYQSTLTALPYLSKEWQENCETERLLGVSVTGQWDSKAARDAGNLAAMRAETVKVNKKYAERFGVNQSTAITCVKPSGTVSKTLNVASGMHARHAPYYIQRIRISATDSLFKLMRESGVPYHPEVGQQEETANTFVLEFPMKAPDGAICKDDISALDQLEHWKTVKEHYTEHNPSVTISVGDDEWIAVANWVYANWGIVGGLSFLPRSSHVYRLAPMEEVTKERYEELARTFPKIDYARLLQYERTDETEQKRELACAGGTCEIE
ncbi:MAG: ribonucleoside-triphosphate reductase [Patescibacteria group bacterium]|nr:ribonucleoside-triphosphate reductase [Patescibacteria group bacterium]MDE1945263.1 ribonucleoside-triphosphate reductase [Patescibacteria group bacterium]MDE2058035.1 ribonucleoside-triphosphate reductase [Patescibacteria group bacterium]